MRKNLVAVFALTLSSLVLMGQISGPTLRTPRLNVGTGTQAATGSLKVQNDVAVGGDLTVTGSCTGCGSATTIGATEVAYGNSLGAITSDGGMTFDDMTGTLTVTAINVGSCTGCGSGGVTQTTGNSTLTFATGCTATQSPSFRYVITGDTVTVMWPTIQCTSNATTFDNSSGALAAAARPANPRFSPLFPVSDNGGEADVGCIRINSNGTVNLFRRTSGNSCGIGWTGSGVKKFPAGSFAYNITD